MFGNQESPSSAKEGNQDSISAEEANAVSHYILSFLSVGAPLYGAAFISLGHVVLPAIGLHSLLVGGGSLSTAAISYLAGGGISLIPAIALYFLINKNVKDPSLSFLLQSLVFAGYIVSSFLVGAALFNISSTSLFLQSLGGGIALAVSLIGVVLAVGLIIFLAAALDKACKKGCASVSECKFALFGGSGDLEEDSSNQTSLPSSMTTQLLN